MSWWPRRRIFAQFCPWEGASSAVICGTARLLEWLVRPTFKEGSEKGSHEVFVFPKDPPVCSSPRADGRGAGSAV